jgi:hypothetical protein
MFRFHIARATPFPAASLASQRIDVSNLPYSCRVCKSSFGPPATQCPKCGAVSWDVSIALTGVCATGHVGKVGLVVEEQRDEESTIKYLSSAGTRSTSTHQSGAVAVDLAGTSGIGRDGESTVAAHIVANLAARGLSAVFEAGQDTRGEDGILVVRDGRYALQCVMAAHEPSIYQTAAHGNASLRVSADAAADWIGKALRAKTSIYSPAHRAKMILAVDIRHAGVALAVARDSTHLLELARQSGFFAVAAVGPLPKDLLWLSDGLG